LLIGPLAAPARAAFSAPVKLSATQIAGAKAAIDADGNVMAVWSHYDGTEWRVQERQISATGALGPVKTISAAREKPLSPQIAGGSRGGAHVIWSCTNGDHPGVEARTISAKGRLGPVRRISAARRPARRPRIASDASGDAIVVWGQKGDTWRIKARRISSKGALGRVKTLSSAKGESGAPVIASDARGGAIAVWQQADGKSSRIKARRISAKGRLGSVKTLSAPGDAGAAQVASDARGNAIVIWRSDTNYSKWRIKARRISSAGAVGKTKILHMGRAGQAQIASNARGDMTVVWEADPNIQARQISATGVLGPTKTLSSPGLNGYSPKIAVDAAGSATALWFEIHSSTSHPDSWYLRARHVSATGALGPTQTLAAEPIRSSQMTVNAQGDAFAVWSQFDGSTWREWGSRGP
jgi:hypothetical protein